MNKPLNWDYIFDCSIKQGITPLFYWSLKKLNNSKDVPPETMQGLEKRYYNNLARNMLFYNELNKVLKAFKKANIDVIVLKGAFLAEEIYKNIGLRPMSDIDLLVKEKDLQKVKVEMNKLMYFPKYVFPTKLHEQQFKLLNEELPYENKTKKITLEIHWNIQSPKHLDGIKIEDFWENAKSVKVAGVETLTFAPENLLQHLCLHVDKHIKLSTAPPAKPLRDFCDIAEVTTYYKNKIDWNYLVQSSKDYEVTEPVFQGLFIAKNYFQGCIPDETIQKLGPSTRDINFEQMFKGIKSYSHKNNQSSGIKYLRNLNEMNGIWNKSRIIIGDIFPSQEFMVYRYPVKNKKQVYAFYLVRSGTAFMWGLAALWQFPYYLIYLKKRRTDTK